MPTVSKYKQTFPKRLLEYGKKGLTPPQVASRFQVSTKTFYVWAKDPSKPKFMAAAERYYTELYAWFDSELYSIATGEKKSSGTGALIYLLRKTLHNQFPDVLIDLKKEIVTEIKRTPVEVKEDLKKLISTSKFNILEFITNDDEEPRSAN